MLIDHDKLRVLAPNTVAARRTLVNPYFVTRAADMEPRGDNFEENIMRALEHGAQASPQQGPQAAPAPPPEKPIYGSSFVIPWDEILPSTALAVFPPRPHTQSPTPSSRTPHEDDGEEDNESEEFETVTPKHGAWGGELDGVTGALAIVNAPVRRGRGRPRKNFDGPVRSHRRVNREPGATPAVAPRTPGGDARKSHKKKTPPLQPTPIGDAQPEALAPCNGEIIPYHFTIPQTAPPLPEWVDRHPDCVCGRCTLRKLSLECMQTRPAAFAYICARWIPRGTQVMMGLPNNRILFGWVTGFGESSAILDSVRGIHYQTPRAWADSFIRHLRDTCQISEFEETQTLSALRARGACYDMVELAGMGSLYSYAVAMHSVTDGAPDPPPPRPEQMQPSADRATQTAFDPTAFNCAESFANRVAYAESQLRQCQIALLRMLENDDPLAIRMIGRDSMFRRSRNLLDRGGCAQHNLDKVLDDMVEAVMSHMY